MRVLVAGGHVEVVGGVVVEGVERPERPVELPRVVEGVRVAEVDGVEVDALGGVHGGHASPLVSAAGQPR